MDNQIKVISLNIEKDNHYETVLPFLQNQNADVICLQEVCQSDIPILIGSSGLFSTFAPMTIVDKDYPDRNMKAKGVEGLLILSKNMPLEIRKDYYVGLMQNTPIFKNEEPYTVNRAVMSIRVEYKNAEFTIATTHFTWTHGGEATELQKKDFLNMMDQLRNLQGFVIAGDFNAPRGREIFTELSKLYKDNIPFDVQTTLDPNLHKVKNLQYVVDGIFSTSQYEVTDVQVIEGISDHKALVCTVSKK